MQVNPVLTKELKLKMRSARASRFTVIYLALLSFIALAACITDYPGPGSSVPLGPESVINTYTALALFQYFLAIIAAALLTAGSINGEKENHTLDLLLCTNYPVHSVITGKLAAAMLHVLLLVTSSLPVMAIGMLYKGVGVSDVVLLLFFYLCTALLTSSIGIFLSVLIQNFHVCLAVTIIASVLITAAVNFYIVKWSLSLYCAYGSANSITDSIPWLWFINPVFGYGSLIDSNSVAFLGGVISGDKTMTYPVVLGIEVRPWLTNVTFYLAASAFFLCLATRRLGPVKKPQIFKWKGMKRR